MVGKLISIVGQTSSGKSVLAIELAKTLGNAEIVSADSRQIYKGMDYSTGKVTKAEMQGVPHHLIDILSPGQEYNLAQFQADAYAAIDNILSRGKVPILVGGTGLYVRAVVQGYNLPKAGADNQVRKELMQLTKEQLLQKLHELGVTNIDPQKSIRHLIRMCERALCGAAEEQKSSPRYKVLQLGIKWPREQIYARIEQRLDARLDSIVAEIKGLIDAGVSQEFMERLGLEAKYASWYLQGKFESFKQFRQLLLTEERHYAKRQDTWLKKESNTIWVSGGDNLLAQCMPHVKQFLENNNEN